MSNIRNLVVVWSRMESFVFSTDDSTWSISDFRDVLKQKAVCSECSGVSVSFFLYLLCSHYHVYNQLPDADSPRVLGTYPPVLTLFTACTIFRLEFNEPFPFLAL